MTRCCAKLGSFHADLTPPILHTDSSNGCWVQSNSVRSNWKPNFKRPSSYFLTIHFLSVRVLITFRLDIFFIQSNLTQPQTIWIYFQDRNHIWKYLMLSIVYFKLDSMVVKTHHVELILISVFLKSPLANRVKIKYWIKKCPRLKWMVPNYQHT